MNSVFMHAINVFHAQRKEHAPQRWVCMPCCCIPVPIVMLWNCYDLRTKINDDDE